MRWLFVLLLAVPITAATGCGSSNKKKTDKTPLTRADIASLKEEALKEATAEFEKQYNTAIKKDQGKVRAAIVKEAKEIAKGWEEKFTQTSEQLAEAQKKIAALEQEMKKKTVVFVPNGGGGMDPGVATLLQEQQTKILQLEYENKVALLQKELDLIKKDSLPPASTSLRILPSGKVEGTNRQFSDYLAEILRSRSDQLVKLRAQARPAQDQRIGIVPWGPQPPDPRVALEKEIAQLEAIKRDFDLAPPGQVVTYAQQPPWLRARPVASTTSPPSKSQAPLLEVTY